MEAGASAEEVKKDRLKMIRVLFLGSSSHASVLSDAMNLMENFDVIGYLDDTVPVDTLKRGYPVLGGFKDIEAVCKRERCRDIVIAFGDNFWRRKVLNELIPDGINFPVIKHPSAIVASSANVGRGSVLLANSHIGRGTVVGDFCVINTGSSIDHDCNLASFSSIAPGVFTGGLVEVGECSHIGVGACISDRKKIGKHTVVGTGSVVVRDIPDFVVAYGNPAKVKRSRAAGEKFL